MVSGRVFEGVGNPVCPPGQLGGSVSVAGMTVALALIGGGNMGAALLGGLLESGRTTPGDLAVAELSAERRHRLEEMFPGVAVVDDVPPCRGAIVAVKPDGARAAAAAAAAAGATRVLSIAAGVRLDALQEAVGPEVAVVRAMPNTPALVGRGASAIAGGATSTGDDMDWAEAILSAVGTVDRLPESLLDAFTGVAGSGPAYVFLIAESLIDAFVAEGVDAAVAERVVTQLLVGSAALLEREGDPATLRRNVTSPGGTTAAGLAVLDEHDLRGAFRAAVAAATRRGRELG